MNNVYNLLMAHLYSVWKECSGTLSARNQLLNMSLPDSSEAVSRVLLFCNNSLFYTNCFNNLEEINTNLRLREQNFFFVSTLKLDNQHQLKNLLLMRKRKREYSFIYEEMNYTNKINVGSRFLLNINIVPHFLLFFCSFLSFTLRLVELD